MSISPTPTAHSFSRYQERKGNQLLAKDGMRSFPSPVSVSPPLPNAGLRLAGVSACFMVSLTPRPHHACSPTRVGANKQLCGLPTALDSPSGMAFLCTTCRKLELCCNFGHRRASRGSSCALKSNPFAVAPVPRARDSEVIVYSCEYNSMPWSCGSLLLSFAYL